jgi:uncharacterized protein (UPF0276 family)
MSPAASSAKSPPPRAPRLGLPDLGIGVGLRIPHYGEIFEQRPSVDWFEIISENFMVAGGRPRRNLERALESYRLVQHGVSMSIGSADPLDFEYLRRLKELVKVTGSPWVSDHLCWTSARGTHLHDLLPLPYTEEALRHVAERCRVVQDFLEVRFCMENVSSYMTFNASVMEEWEFVSRLAEEADIGLLLDVNNVFVSASNHGFDARTFIDAVPADRVTQIHLAGHTDMGRYIIDTHSGHVVDPVWDLYRHAIERIGSVSTLIEWDDDIPTLDVLLAEAEKARDHRDRALAARAARAA